MIELVAILAGGILVVDLAIQWMRYRCRTEARRRHPLGRRRW